MKKKIFVLMLLSFVITLSVASFTGCGKDNVTATADTATAVSKTIKAEEKATTTETLPAGEINATTQAVTSSNSSSSSTISSDNSSKSEDNKSNKSNDTQSEKTNSNSSSDTKTSSDTIQKSDNNSSSEKSNAVQKSDNTNKSDNTSSSSQATWHEAVYKTVHHDEVTEKVWVVDKAAYTYEEPIYETHGRTFCGMCGADITEDLSSHGKMHLKNGEDCWYYDKWVDVQVGTKTITVPEEGHYETKIVTKSYDEQVLVKEAGYY